MITTNRALIIDSIVIMRGVIRDILNPFFSEIYEESAYKEAWYIFCKKLPFLVTIELSIDPQKSLQGLKLIQSLHKKNPQSHIIVISASDQNKIRDKAYNCGVTAFLTKPFDAPTLQSLVKNILQEAKGELV
jgi:DNA-binding NtrC family response regulator